MVISVAAPAKINLHLEIVGRRWDGFHEIRTLLQSIDLLQGWLVQAQDNVRLAHQSFFSRHG